MSTTPSMFGTFSRGQLFPCDFNPEPLPCYDPANKVCYGFECLKPLDPAGKCDTPTNCCPCNTVYNDGTKWQG